MYWTKQQHNMKILKVLSYIIALFKSHCSSSVAGSTFCTSYFSLWRIILFSGCIWLQNCVRISFARYVNILMSSSQVNQALLVPELCVKIFYEVRNYEQVPCYTQWENNGRNIRTYGVLTPDLKYMWLIFFTFKNFRNSLNFRTNVR